MAVDTVNKLVYISENNVVRVADTVTGIISIFAGSLTGVGTFAGKHKVN
jgi:hypothetical protein